MNIAVDAMGGDRAPQVVVAGALAALKTVDFHLLLVGKEEQLRQELQHHDIKGLSIEIVPATQVVEMEDPPIVALRQKSDSSIRVAISLVKEKRADAIVTAGNTGATMITAKRLLGTLKGIERPAIASVLPSLKGHTLLLDVGANVNCKPFHLLQFAIMGNIYAKYILGRTNPVIGLLNIGEEAGKGNDTAKERFELLKNSELNFIGNVEGYDIFNGHTDVVICDGFIGNISLKVSEGVVALITTLFKQEFQRSFRARLGSLLLQPALKSLKKHIDYSEYGGAPLLGIDGTCIISHGASSAKAIKNAIRVAASLVSHNINQAIAENTVQRGVVSKIFN